MSESAGSFSDTVEQYLQFREGAEAVMRKYDENPDLDPADMTFEERVWLQGFLTLEKEGDFDDVTQRGQHG